MIGLAQTADQEHNLFELFFAEYLTSEWKFERTPKGIPGLFEEAQSGRDKSAQIFLQVSCKAWVAYFLAKKRSRGGQNYEGKLADQSTLSAFQQLSSEEQRKIATSLANTKAHSTVPSWVENSEELSTKTKRRRLDYTVSLCMTPSTIQPANQTQDRLAATPLDNGSELEPTTTLLPRSAVESLPNDMPGGIAETSDASYQESVRNPSSKRLSLILSQYLCGAVVKNGDTAAITIAFPSHLSHGKVHCVMTLVILPNKVQHLAMVLFGIHIETEGNLRYILQPNGSRMLPGDVTLERAQRQAISDWLGTWVNRATTSSPVRKEEDREGILTTSSVTMQITSGCHDYAYLNIRMGLDEGFRTKEQLF